MDWQDILFAGYTVSQLLAIAGAVAVATTVQAAAGFGFALLALPVILRVDVPLQEAVVFTVIVQVWQQASNLYNVRTEVKLRPLLPVMVLGVVFIGLGVFFQRNIVTLDQTLVRQCLGVLILAMLVLMWLWKPKHHKTLHAGWGVLTGACAGTLSGIASIPGPPIGFWVMAHDWSNKRSRGAMWAIFLTFTPCLFAILWFTYGSDLLKTAVPALLFIPLAQVASMIGLRLGHSFSKERIRRVAWVLLLLTAVSAILRV